MSIEIEYNVEISNDKYRKCVNETLERLIKLEKLSKPKCRLTEACKKGSNFLGAVYRAVIEGEKDGKRQTISLIMKCPPNNVLCKQFMCMTHCFSREIEFYEKIVPTFQKLISEHGMTIDYIPKYYYGNDKEDEEILVLEDLNLKGFGMKGKPTHLDYPHLSLTLRHLGTFHAYSFALRDKKPEELENLKTKDNYYHDEMKVEEMSGRADKLANAVKIVLADDDKHYTERFEAFYQNYWDNMVEACDGQLAEPYAVINHGDAWTNNLMFKYNKGILDPKVMYLLDFQMYRYASPALDLFYLLFCCCDQTTRDQFYERLLHDYHNSLSECLIKLGSDPERLFPFDMLLNQLHKFGNYGAGMCLLVTHLFTYNDERDVPEMGEFNDDLDQLDGRLVEDKLYRTTLRDCFKDLIDRNYL